MLKTFGHYVVDRVNSELPREQRKKPYTKFMLIDGNDDRGIDVGLMTKEDFDFEDMRSHVHDLDDT